MQAMKKFYDIVYKVVMFLSFRILPGVRRWF